MDHILSGRVLERHLLERESVGTAIMAKKEEGRGKKRGRERRWRRKEEWGRSAVVVVVSPASLSWDRDSLVNSSISR